MTRVEIWITFAVAGLLLLAVIVALWRTRGLW
jgi:hypothetical protein